MHAWHRLAALFVLVAGMADAGDHAQPIAADAPLPEWRAQGAPREHHPLEETPDARAFLSALNAPGPAPKVAGLADIFAPLLGSWDLDVVFFNPDGSVRRQAPGEWHFARVLEGRAIQDVWIVPPRAMRTAMDPAPGEYGTTLRFHDPRINAWRCVWHGIVNGIVWPFTCRRIADELVLERLDEDGTLMHWVFFDIRPQGFQWRSEVSTDGGRHWRVDQRMHARRKPANPFTSATKGEIP